MPLQAITTSEPIPGYRIVERIGAGGYGEVWKAEVPGGLTKAVKFVYGYLDEDRASRELKALNRIKTVRHPFLLSLERIEVVDGQLLIVTELADASLKDRFESCQKANECPGIERPELLGYMRDAADVLDYMSEQHSLQHLDIKPENLLLVAGRIKVADFGLVKDIHDATASLMGGLTPLYAPPEVFDGKPSRWSDQYSLAIVYMEMLTGELPFPGKTAVQLARQHLNARPRLSGLPPEDQPTIARALSKNPRDRFRSCREMVDALCGTVVAGAGDEVRSAETATSGNCVTEPTTGDKRRPKSQTALLPDGGEQLADLMKVKLPRVPEPSSVVALPPLEITDSQLTLQPTLYLAIGRCGAKALQRLKQRLEDRFGPLAEMPVVQMLLMDTDCKELMESTHGAGNSGLSPADTLGMPLRRPQEYRNDSRRILQWLSRRWLYNIPRSLKTEGLRPLGRLAFVDHAEKIFEKVREALQACVNDESIAKSQQTTGLNSNPGARVVLLTSISGGTGGGMALDVAYGVRNVMNQMEIEQQDLVGMFMHSTPRNPRTRELAVVNAYSFLSELNHYCRPGGYYPGDRACKLPEADAGVLTDCYLIQLGDELTDADFEYAVDNVANYLYLEAATPAASFLRQCRKAAEQLPDESPEYRLRSFGLRQISCSQDDIIALAVETLCRGVSELWQTGEIDLGWQHRRKRVASSEQVDKLSLRNGNDSLREQGIAFFQTLNVNAAECIQHFTSSVMSEFDGDPDTQCSQRISEIQDAYDESRALTRETHLITETLGYMDSLMGPLPGREDRRVEPGMLEENLAPLRKKLALKKAEQIGSWLRELCESKEVRVDGAMVLLKTCQEHLESIQEQTQVMRDELRREMTSHLAPLTASDDHRHKMRSGKPSGLAQQLQQLFRLRINDFVLHSVERFQQALKGQLAGLRDEFLDLGREVKHLTSQFASWEPEVEQAEGDESANAFDDLTRAITNLLMEQMPELIQRLDEQAQQQVLAVEGGLRQILAGGGAPRSRLPGELRNVARSLLVSELKQMDVANLLFGGDQGSDRVTEALRESLEAARPSLLDCGGAKRLLVMLPDGSTDTRPLEILHQDLKEAPSVVPNCDGDFVICYEAEQISLTQAAVKLVESRQDYVEYAARLHTRTDVQWSALPDLI